jgi:hypothetical protein
MRKKTASVRAAKPRFRFDNPFVVVYRSRTLVPRATYSLGGVLRAALARKS